MGLTGEEVELYETMKDPPRELLREWSHGGNGTIEELIRLLSELEREDIISEIKGALAPPPSLMVTPPPAVKAKEENLPPNIL